MSNLPESDTLQRRPIFERVLRRKHSMPVHDPPSEEERSDAILILKAGPWTGDGNDALYEEAFDVFIRASE